MSILRAITRTRAKMHHDKAASEERKTQKVLLARNKAVKEAERKEKLAQAREDLARAKERKQKAEERLKPKDKAGKKKINWYQVGVKIFAPFQEKPKKTTRKPKARKRRRKG